jgi:hypothetical protein
MGHCPGTSRPRFGLSAACFKVGSIVFYGLSAILAAIWHLGEVKGALLAWQVVGAVSLVTLLGLQLVDYAQCFTDAFVKHVADCRRLDRCSHSVSAVHTTI